MTIDRLIHHKVCKSNVSTAPAFSFAKMIPKTFKNFYANLWYTVPVIRIGMIRKEAIV